MNRYFWYLTGGQAINMFGSSFGQFAQAWLVYEMTGSKVAMGTLLFLAMVPETLLRLVGGPLVDRFNRLRLLAGMDAVQAMLYATPALLAGTGLLQVWHLYVFAILAGVSRALYSPTYMALIPSIVESKALVRANSVSQNVTQGLGLLSPALAGLLVGTVGPVPALIVDTVSYVISALVTISVPAAMGQVQATPSKGKYLSQLEEGFHFYRQVPALVVLLVAAAGINLAMGASNSMLVPLVSEQMKLDAGAMGMMTSALSAGMLVGGLIAGRLPATAPVRFTMLIPLAVGGLSLMAFSTLGVGALPMAMVLSALTGLGIGLYNPQSGALYQRLVPEQLRGRVMSVRLTVAWGALPLGSFLGALLADALGLQSMFAIMGLVPVLVAMVAMRHPALQKSVEPTAASKAA